MNAIQKHLEARDPRAYPFCCRVGGCSFQELPTCLSHICFHPRVILEFDIHSNSLHCCSLKLRVIFCTMSKCSLPPKLLQWVDGWVRDLKRRVVAALAAAHAQRQSFWPRCPAYWHRLQWGGSSDPCSSGLRLQYRHSWSSEIAAAPKRCCWQTPR